MIGFCIFSALAIVGATGFIVANSLAKDKKFEKECQKPKGEFPPSGTEL